MDDILDDNFNNMVDVENLDELDLEKLEDLIGLEDKKKKLTIRTIPNQTKVIEDLSMLEIGPTENSDNKVKKNRIFD